MGYGRFLLETLNDVAISEDVFDVTVEEPIDHLQHIRACIDTLRLLDFDPIESIVSSAVSCIKKGKLSKKLQTLRLSPPQSAIEDVRTSLKINKKQFLYCWEVLIYLGLFDKKKKIYLGFDPVAKHLEDFSTIISNRVKYDILGKDSGTSGKRLTQVPSEYDQEMSFVMFRSEGNASDTVQMDDNQEEQVQKLVEERLDEIKLIAKKVTQSRSRASPDCSPEASPACSPDC